MADVFISYSKADRDLALKLSAYLESEGWSVWWDKSLGAGDAYRDEIMKQLAAARAVIVIWTENSIKSDWVRAEAGRAKADGKLIPVKASGVNYADIPLPFGEMHTENVTSLELIRAAVITQLEKPITPLSSFRQVQSAFQGQLLTWIGIVGGAITLFTNLKEVLALADWAVLLVTYWHNWTATFWSLLFSWIGIKIPLVISPMLSFALFSAMLVLGINASNRYNKRERSDSEIRSIPRKVLILGIMMITYVVTLVGLVAILIGTIDLFPSDPRIFNRVFEISAGSIIIGFPIGFGIYITRKQEQLLTGITSVLFTFCGICLMIPSLKYYSSHYGGSNLEWMLPLSLGFTLLFPLCWMAALLFTPIRPLTRRLSFLALGVGILLGLSEISTFHLHEYLSPPKIG
jgi:hypothetical protein